ncbi:MAG: penicillin-binding transpeptidase domain-containing protein [Gammaproteobacteria bacterium]|nr:penicillin-binding transpeptidase domain-containing protein [Gammaproteobacteria bacterium]
MKSKAKTDAMLLRSFTLRSRCATFALLGLAAVLVIRTVWLQAYENEFLTHQADVRQLRVAKIPAHRGVITDRNGEPLAVSTPVDSIWVNPGEIVRAPDRIPQLAAALGIDAEELARRLTRNITREFMYLKRHMRPDDAVAIVRLNIPGVDVEREYQRYYPAGEVIGHVVGFTNIDDVGQEGLELAFDHWLAGRPGKKRVLKDRLGRVVEDVERIQSPNPGRELATSIDLRIQYLAYRELKAVIKRSEAASGSVVVLDVGTGEVLAMVNQPTYNPNDRAQFSPVKYRNRAITDIFEPGSTLKTLVIAAALESGQYHTASRIDTSPGFIKVGAKVIEDERNLGTIDLKTLLARSSNVGATKVAMSLPAETLYNVLSGFGLGRLSGSGFPGESAGLLSHYSNWRPISLATLAYGYGLSVTPLQLAQAYSVIAAGGLQHPVSLLRLEQAPIARRIITEQTAGAVLSMLEAVVSDGGTGQQATVAGYRVAGKTGTVKKFTAGGYAEDHHMALFSGIAPATRPRLAVVVLIDDPSNGEYYGGAVAAPVFSRIVEGSLRILAIPPDNFMRPVGTTKLAVSRP